VKKTTWWVLFEGDLRKLTKPVRRLAIRVFCNTIARTRGASAMVAKASTYGASPVLTKTFWSN
jgi:hypothetical protein